MKCTAKTSKGARCTFTASTKVEGHGLCGNHAAKRQKELGETPKTVAEGVTLFQKRREAPMKEMPAGAEDMLSTLETLQASNVPRRVIVQLMAAWKDGLL